MNLFLLRSYSLFLQVRAVILHRGHEELFKLEGGHIKEAPMQG